MPRMQGLRPHVSDRRKLALYIVQAGTGVPEMWEALELTALGSPLVLDDGLPGLMLG